MKQRVDTQELQNFAENFIQELTPETNAIIIALSGDLGAGKTTFSQYVAQALGVKESVTSPTFVIQKTYPLPDGQFKTLVHIDAYRLKGGDELKMLGWHDIIQEPTNLVLIEWPENVQGVIPDNAHNIKLIYVDERYRDLFYEKK